MVSVNPFGDFRSECERLLMESLKQLFPDVSVPSFRLALPPDPRFGELSSSICFELAKLTTTKPIESAEQIADTFDAEKFSLIQSVKAASPGYVNFYADLAELSALLMESVSSLDPEYGCVKTDSPKKIIVEHTSVNPLHPIHVGQARNPVLGDSLARVLRARGHQVSRHYYVDDVGRQTAVIAYGYEKLGKPKPEGKPDHFIGIIYTITSCIMEIRRLEHKIEDAKRLSANEEILALQKELDDWTSIAIDLEDRFGDLFSRLLDTISRDEDPESIVNGLIRGYEAGEERSKLLIREVSQMCLEGFKKTLDKAGISFDSWDWESDLVWSSEVTKTLEGLKKTPYVFHRGAVLEFDAEKVARDLNLKKVLGLSEDYEIPSLTLVRADGTTLYSTRDIPYSLWKFQKAEKVINVVGMEQTLAQIQLKLALCALGYVDQAKRLVHFAYNLVTLLGYKMSSRRGRYITFDEVMDEAVNRAHEEVKKRSRGLSDEEKRQSSEMVGIGAVKYALVEVDTSKPVVFTWDRVLDFEKNSAPYVQYSHARACSILRKASEGPKNPDYSLLSNPLEREIVLMLSRFPEVFVDAADNLKPNILADFASLLADKFNTFYNALPVIKASPKGLSDARLALVDATRIVFRNALNPLGIWAPEKM